MSGTRFIEQCRIDDLCRLVTEERDFTSQEEYVGFMQGPVNQAYSHTQKCLSNRELHIDPQILAMYDGMEALNRSGGTSKSSIAKLCQEKAKAPVLLARGTEKSYRRQDYERGIYELIRIVTFAKRRIGNGPDHPDYQTDLRKLRENLDGIRKEFSDHQGVEKFFQKLDERVGGNPVLFADVVALENEIEPIGKYTLGRRLGFGVSYDFEEDFARFQVEIGFAGAFTFNGKVLGDFGISALDTDTPVFHAMIGGYGTLSLLSAWPIFRHLGFGDIDFGAAVGGAFASPDHPKFSFGAKGALNANVGIRIAGWNTKDYGSIGLTYMLVDAHFLFGGGDPIGFFTNGLSLRYSGTHYDDNGTLPEKASLAVFNAGQTRGVEFNTYSRSFRANLSDEPGSRSRVEGYAGLYAGNVEIGDDKVRAAVMAKAGVDLKLVPGILPDIALDVNLGPTLGDEQGLAVMGNLGVKFLDINGFEGSIVLSGGAGITETGLGVAGNVGARINLDMSDFARGDVSLPLEMQVTTSVNDADDDTRMGLYFMEESEHGMGEWRTRKGFGLTFDNRDASGEFKLRGVTGLIGGGFHLFGLIPNVQTGDFDVLNFIFQLEVGADFSGSPSVNVSLDTGFVRYTLIPDDGEGSFTVGAGLRADIFGINKDKDPYVIFAEGDNGKSKIHIGPSVKLGGSF